MISRFPVEVITSHEVRLGEGGVGEEFVGLEGELQLEAHACSMQKSFRYRGSFISLLNAHMIVGTAVERRGNTSKGLKDFT